MKLLHLSASPRGAQSESFALARTFLAALPPDVTVDEWDLWDGTLPAFGPEAAAAKMAVFAGETPTSDAWTAAKDAFERFAAADAYLFSVPMWNHGIPYVLKQLIDVVSQPGMVFGFDPEHGYTGLLTGRSAIALYTSAVYGEDRPPAFGEDFQRPYLESWLRWAGVADIASVQFRPNLATADAEQGRTTAHAEAAALARRFHRAAA
jgi:FMN-dependent NADH-azoreductase